MRASDIQDRMEQRFEQELGEMGYDLRYVEWTQEGPEWYLRFFIDRDQGISIEDCEAVSRHLDPILDREFDGNKQGYILEVSSPGLEAPLRKDRDYRQALDEWVHVKTYQKIDGRKEFEGYLRSYDPQHLEIEIEGTVVRIERERISSARLAIRF